MAPIELKNETKTLNCKQTEERFVHADYDIAHVHFYLGT